MNRAARLLLVLVSFPLARFARADDPACEVNVNIAMTPDGRKWTAPTPQTPAYYYPVVGGFRAEGAQIAGEKAPPVKPIIHLLAKALARQHYLVVSPQHQNPSLLLVLFWGAMNPEIDDVGDFDNPQKVFYNQKDMVALLGGQTLGNLDLDFEREAVMQGAEDNRYFVLVSAYDFAAARQHKKVLLWQARMSTPSGGVTLDAAIPALVAAGEPLFGHETMRPKWVTLPAGRQANVEVGEPEFKNYVDTPAAVASPAKSTPPAPAKP